MRILSREIESPDHVANAAIAEAADRLEELDQAYIKIWGLHHSEEAVTDMLIDGIKKELAKNCHLADGEDCTLIGLKRLLRQAMMLRAMVPQASVQVEKTKQNSQP